MKRILFLVAGVVLVLGIGAGLVFGLGNGPKTYTVEITSNIEQIEYESKNNCRLGDNITFEAIPIEGYRFIGWEVDGDFVSEDPRYEITLTQENVNSVYKALYKQIFNIYTGEMQNGEVSTNVTKAIEDETITLTITPNDHYAFESAYYILDSETEHIAITNQTFTMPNGNVTVYANFQEIEYSITSAELEHGTLSFLPTVGTYGIEIVVTVTPDTGYELTPDSLHYATENIANGEIAYTNGIYSFIMPGEDVIVHASFRRITFSVTVPSQQTGYTIEDTNNNAFTTNSVQYGDSVSFKVVLNTGYNGTPIVRNNNDLLTPSNDIYTISNVTSNVNITVEGITATEYTLTFPEEVTVTRNNVQLTTGATIYYGDILTLSPTTAPAEGTTSIYVINGTETTGNTVTVTGNVTIEYFGVKDASEYQTLTFTYDETNQTAEVKANTSNKPTGELIIPPMVKHNNNVYVITGIGVIAFKECANITSVIIPQGIICIKDGAFQQSGLTSIILEPGSQLESIGDYAFFECRNLTNIVLPNGLKSIGAGAFYMGKKITGTIIIPESVTSVGNRAFGGCDSIDGIVVQDGNTVYDSRNNCNAIIVTATNTLLCGCGNTTIPNSITSIEFNAFTDMGSLLSVSIPNSVTSIGSYAFYNCTGLTSVTISEGIDSLAESLFYGCTSLTSVTIPENVTSIGSYAFRNCRSLTSITIPNSVTGIGNSAFTGCYALAEVYNKSTLTITKSTTYNGEVAYNAEAVYSGDTIDTPTNIYLSNDGVAYYKESESSYIALVCKDKTKTTISLDSRTTRIRSYAFSGCTSLTSITIPNGVTSIGGLAFSGCSSLTSITIPNNVTSIGTSTFSGCSSLTSVTIPNSVTSIGNYAFRDCSSLTSVTIPDGVTSIGSAAFYNCSSLTSITIGRGVDSVGSSAFWNCNKLYIVNNLSQLNIRAENSDYGDVAYYAHLVIRDENFSYDKIEEIDGVLYYNQSSLSKIAVGLVDTTRTTITLNENTTEIYYKAFYNCSSLTSVTIPRSVSRIGQYVFWDCYALESVTFENPDGWLIFDTGDETSGTDVTLTDPTSNAHNLMGSYYSNYLALKTYTISVGDEPICYTLKSVNNTQLNITSVVHGGSLSFRIALDYGYENSTITVYNNGVLIAENSGVYTISNITNDVVITVDGIQPDAYTITIPANVTVTVNGDEVSNNTVHYGDNIVLSANATPGYVAVYSVIGATQVTGQTNTYNVFADVTITYSEEEYIGNASEYTKFSFSYYNDTLTASVWLRQSVSGELVYPHKVRHNDQVYIVTTIMGAQYGVNKNLVTSVVIPDTVTKIESAAFSNWTNLASISIPNSITFVGSSALSSAALTGTEYQGGIYLGNAENPYVVLWETLDNTVSEFTIHEDCRIIYDRTFYEFTNLTKIFIPENVVSIGEWAFANCNSLTRVVAASLESWMKINFNEHCCIVRGVDLYILNGTDEELLTNVVVPNTITEIKPYAFMENRNITSITISSNVKSIGQSAFTQCTFLTDVNFENNSQLATIEAYAFYYCERLTNITIPASVTSIKTGAFSYCNHIKKVITPSVENWLSISFVSSDSNPLYNSYGDGAKLYTINGANEELVTSIVVPNTITKIKSYSLWGYAFLTDITLNEYVTSIGNYAFYNCSALTSITMPESLTSIDSYAFGGCDSLATVTINSEDIYNQIEGTYSVGCLIEKALTIYVPASIVGDGESNTFLNDTEYYTKTTEDIAGVQYYKFGAKYLEYEFDDTTQTITITGIKYEYQSTKFIVIPSQLPYDGNMYPVTSIGDYAFNYYESLISVIISNGVTSIGNSAFAGCVSLISVTLPNSVTNIGDSAFYECGSLTSINIPSSVTSISDYTFSYCHSLANITIPSSVTNIGDSAFYACTSLTSINIPSSVTSIGSNYYDTFGECGKLATVIINNANIYNFIDSESVYTESLFRGVLPTIYVPVSIVGDGTSNTYLNDANNFIKTTETIDSVNYYKYEMVSPFIFTIIEGTTNVSVQAKYYLYNTIFPSTVEIEGTTYTVTQIESGAIKVYNYEIGYIYIPEGVTTLGGEEYGDIFDSSDFTVEGITIPSTIEYMNEDVFCGACGIQEFIINSEYVYNGLYSEGQFGNLYSMLYNRVCVLKSIVDASENKAFDENSDFIKTTETIDGKEYYVYTYC